MQATGRREINAAVNVMDRAMQDNATMVQRMTDASRTLARWAEDLNALLAQFSIDREDTRNRALASAACGGLALSYHRKNRLPAK